MPAIAVLLDINTIVLFKLLSMYFDVTVNASQGVSLVFVSCMFCCNAVGACYITSLVINTWYERARLAAVKAYREYRRHG